jgi:hypothetical protein
MDVPIVIYYDHISSILLANNPVYHAKTKHIEVHYHFIREKIIAKENERYSCQYWRSSCWHFHKGFKYRQAKEV